MDHLAFPVYHLQANLGLNGMMFDTGDRIRIHGNVELTGPKAGCVYRVSYVYDHVDGTVYAFSKGNSRRIACSHFASRVDARVCEGTPRVNCIEKLPK